MLIKTYMRENPVVLTQDKAFAEALKHLLEQKTNGVVVIESEESRIPVGVLSSFHLAKAVVPAHLLERSDLAGFASPDLFSEWVHQAAQRPVYEYMQALPHESWLHEDDSIEKAVTLSAQEDLMYIPVVRREGHALTGLISRTDIKRAMADAMGYTF